jgi:hypothetical protein
MPTKKKATRPAQSTRLRRARTDAGGKGCRRDAPVAARRGHGGVRPRDGHRERRGDRWPHSSRSAAGSPEFTPFALRYSARPVGGAVEKAPSPNTGKHSSISARNPSGTGCSGLAFSAVPRRASSTPPALFSCERRVRWKQPVAIPPPNLPLRHSLCYAMLC